MCRTVICKMRALGGCEQAKTIASATSDGSIMRRVLHALLGTPVAHGELRLYAAGADRSLHLDVVLAQLCVQRLGKSDLRELAGAVDGLARVALQARNRRDEENLAAFCAIIPGAAWRVKRKLLFMFASISASYSSALVSTRSL